MNGNSRVALPAGGLTLFEPVGARRLFAGENRVSDLAIGEDVEFDIGASPDVRWKLVRLPASPQRESWRVEITNARDVAIDAEIILPFEPAEKPTGLKRGRGGWVLPVAVPANGVASVEYAVKLGR